MIFRMTHCIYIYVSYPCDFFLLIFDYDIHIHYQIIVTQVHFSHANINITAMIVSGILTKMGNLLMVYIYAYSFRISLGTVIVNAIIITRLYSFVI